MTFYNQIRNREEPFFRIGELYLNFKNTGRKIKLGNYELNDFEIIYHEKHGRTTSFDIFVFLLDTRKYTEFDKLDLTDDLICFDWGERVFNGYVENMTFYNYLAVIEGKGYQRDFQSSKIGIESKNIEITEEPSDLIYTVARFFWTPEHMNIEKVNLIEREFVNLIPILGLINNTDEIVINDIYLNSKLPEDESRILYSFEYIGHEDWNDRYSRARVIIKASNFYDAIQQAVERVKRIIELITLRNDISFTNYLYSQKSSFHDQIHSSYIRLSPIVFCKEHNTDRAIILDVASNKEEGFDLYSKYLDTKFLDSIRPLAAIIGKDLKSLSRVERTLLGCLQWLRISFEFTDLSIKIMALTNSLEFVIKETKIKHKFAAIELFLIKEIVDNGVRKLKLSEEQVRIISDKLNGLNDAPLLARIEEFLMQNHISFDTYEMDIIRKLRRNRNKLQHGVSDFIINKKEVHKLRTLIERILIFRLNDLNKR